MATATIGQLTLAGSAAAGDLLEIETVGGVSRAITKANFIGVTLTGGGTLALGANTLTVPASGVAALKSGSPTPANLAGWADANNVNDGGFALSDIARLSVSQTLAGFQTFTGGSQFAPAALSGLAGFGFEINLPSGSAGTAYRILYNGVNRYTHTISPTVSQLRFLAFDAGNTDGPNLFIERNNNASTPSAAYLRLLTLSGANALLWPDNTGVWRTSTAALVTNASDTSGTVVGSQTSHAASKAIADGLSPLDEVLARIEAGAAAVRRFSYRSGAFGNQVFEGVITDEAPDYGMDRDADHPQGKSLNEIQILGDLLRMMTNVAGRLAALEPRSPAA